MSILTFLLFTSALYFATADDNAPKPIADFQDDLKQLLDLVNKGVEDYISSNINFKDLPDDDKKYLQAVINNGFADYVNTATYIASGEKDPSKTDNDDVIVRFETLESFFSGIPFEPLTAFDKQN